MPLFDFKCTNPECHHIDEDVWYRNPEELETMKCSKCGAKAIYLPASNFQFGDSFYDPGDIKKLEIVHKDADGKEHVYTNMQDKVDMGKYKFNTKQPKRRKK